MAPPRLYESPIAQLLRLLADAKARGLRFEAAWDEAVRPGRPLVMSNAKLAPEGALRWPTDRTDRLAWQAAIIETREQWRRAYYNEPPVPSEAAVRLLADDLGALELVADDRAASEGIGAGMAVSSAA